MTRRRASANGRVVRSADKNRHDETATVDTEIGSRTERARRAMEIIEQHRDEHPTKTKILNGRG